MTNRMTRILRCNPKDKVILEESNQLAQDAVLKVDQPLILQYHQQIKVKHRIRKVKEVEVDRKTKALRTIFIRSNTNIKRAQVRGSKGH